MRTFLPKRDDERESALIKQLRTDRPLLPYARRSDPIAKDEKKDKSQSREMQTEDMIKWGKMKGWVESLIYPYFADLGLSGTLRPDQRPDMLRLFDDLDSGKLDHSTLACWQENRLFRDETHIYYNQLIDKMLQHDVVLVVLSPRLYIYDMRDEYDKKRLRDKLKEAAEFIPHHVKGFLHPARERATWEDDEWAGMGDPPPGFVVDLDPKSPTYKHLIPYWPHIEKVREYFLLYMEMGGEIGLVNQRLRAWPIVFPEFGPEVDRVNVNKLKLSRYPGSGYYIRSLINVALQEVRIEVVSTHWMRVEISWLHEEWGREEIYYRRGRGARKEWTEEELAIIQEHYETMPRLQLMGLLPNRSWEAIRKLGMQQGLSRRSGNLQGEIIRSAFNNSYSDLQFLRRVNISESARNTNWRRLSH